MPTLGFKPPSLLLQERVPQLVPLKNPPLGDC